MRQIWISIQPTRVAARLLVLDGPAKVLLKARLPPAPSHPSALTRLCEALALWTGRPVRVALDAAGRRSMSDTPPWRAAVALAARSPHFQLDLVAADGSHLGGPPLEDARQLVLFPRESR